MTDDIFCRFCGAAIPKESHFCLKCGATLTSTPPAEHQLEDFPHSRQNEPSTHEPDAPQYFSQKQASPSGLGPSFWLGFVGGVFGILGEVLESQIAELRSLLLLNESASIHKNEKEAPESGFEPESEPRQGSMIGRYTTRACTSIMAA